MVDAERRVSVPALTTARGTRRVRANGSAGAENGRGQSLVEFALVLLPLLAILLGIIQMGFVFNAYVTVANAAREGARAGSIWVPDPNVSQGANDSSRATYIRNAVNGSLGFLNPGDATTTIEYDATTTANGCRGTATDPRRKDQCVVVSVTYKLTLIIPLIAGLLPQDSSGKLPVPAQSQMVIN